MVKRIIAIAFIFACASAAWLALGVGLMVRTEEADKTLRGLVASNWGTPHLQRAPEAFVQREAAAGVRRGSAMPAGARAPVPTAPSTGVTGRRDSAEPEIVDVPLPLERTRASVSFDLDHRRKGLLWYNTYSVAFEGTYTFRKSSASDAAFIRMPLPAAQAIYDDLRVTVDGATAPYEVKDQVLLVSPGTGTSDTMVFSVSYRSQGLGTWRYALGGDVAEVRDFLLTMRTDFEDIDFAENTMSPTSRQEIEGGWELQWQYANLLSGFQIGMEMPSKLQPGPIAGRISLFAPVSLLFFFAAMFLITAVRRIELHPMNYAFLAAGFFAFHLLMAYLADHISIHVAFLVSAAVSVGLVVSYLRLVVGPRFALREAAITQVIYLVLFSYAFFFEGFTGLAITIGSILTLLVAMQATGRVRWAEVFANQR